MSKGRFCISGQIGMLCEGLSTYQVSSSVEREQDGSSVAISEEWIDDFNRRLGLLEKKQDQSTSEDSPLRNIESFQQTFKVSVCVLHTIHILLDVMIVIMMTLLR